MKIKYAILLGFCILASSLYSQQETECDPPARVPTQGEVIFNYGSATNAFSFSNRSSYTVAQPLIGSAVSQEFTTQMGFWSRFLIPPQAPLTTSSQGDFPDRVLIKWELDPLSSTSAEGYVVTRDGAFLSQVDSKITQFIDFNVQAGEFYDYGVYGRNIFGNGSIGHSIGFVNPNGSVTGEIQTFSGNPVAGAVVKLTPTIGKSLSFDGIDDNLCISHHANVPTNMWTTSAWVKIGATHDSDGILDLGSDINKNFWIHTTPAANAKGITIGVGDGTVNHELSFEFASNPDDWHQVAAVYSAGTLLLYVDGSFVSSMQAPILNENTLFSIGSRRNQTGFFDGMIDDVRIYNRPLNSTEILLTKDITVSKTTPGLVAYWKFDEGVGSKVFDISDNDMHAKINGPIFSDNTADVVNAGMTDVSGFYSIEGINYSKVENFKAKPSKIFYSNYALEFNAAYAAYGVLTDFDLPDTSTVEIIIHPFDIQSVQSLLNKGSDDFNLWIEAGSLKLTLNGETQVLGPVTTSYQHISLILDGGSNQVMFHRNGSLENTLSYANLGGTWTGTPWIIGVNNTTAADFYTGLIDEVAFYNDALSIAEIQLNAAQFGDGGTNVGNAKLMSYFDLNEGKGNPLEDSGPAMSGEGSIFNAFYSIITYKQVEDLHLFRPSERLVNVNPSNTAASGIDFIDESTVTISGVVRFEDTFCYQDSVEILINGNPAFPPIFTDADGRFVGDFEPGVTITLTPKYQDHVLTPGFFQVRRLNRPIANVLFQNQTKREISGQLAGGHCKLSVIPMGAIVKVKVASLNGCYEQVLTLEDANGKFKFTNLPPIPLAVSVLEHSNNIIYNYFQIQGGSEVDMRNTEKDTVDFTYISPPQVYIQPFDENGCMGDGRKMIDQSVAANGYKEYSRNVRVFEEYDGGSCYLDSFTLIVDNDIGDQAQYTMDVDTSTYPLKLWAGLPNLGGDHTKFLQVTADVNGALATEIERVVVLGERSRESTFTTASPTMPQIILRDPPGDGSSATLAKGTTFCNTWSNASLFSITDNFGLEIDLGSKVIAYAGTPFGGLITETEVVNELSFYGSFGASTNEEESSEVCITNEIEYSTSSDDAILYGDADLYVGAAVNFEFSATDILSFDPDVCDFNLGQSVRVNPSGFGTKYVYSEWQIKTDVIPSLELLGDFSSADAWRKIIEFNKSLKSTAKIKENVTFDALTTFTETASSSSTNSYNFSTDISWTAGFNSTLGFEVFGAGTKVSLGIDVGGNSSESGGFSETNDRSVSYTLADDDPNDNFTIDILDDAVFGTPVFQLRAGESMCPWEPGTLNREEVGFSLDKLTAVNIDEHESANFLVTITNLGQTGNDALVYTIGKVQGTNPDAAGFLLDGSDFVGNIDVQLQPFQSKEFLLQINKGPVEYSYSDLGIFMASMCQLDHSFGLGYDLAGAYTQPMAATQGQYATADLNKFYKQFSLDVEFIEPCSPIDIGFPLQDWVQTPSEGNVLFITLNSYLFDDPDLELVRVQYRRTGGDGTWTNIVELPKSEFAADPVFKIVQWDMTELSDGPFEIRAITQCFNVSLNPGISTVVKGRKETRPPKLFGTPQPADGVLGPGDEISVTFSKRINCDLIFQADGIGSNINLNNLALLDLTAGGILLDATITCKDEKIIIVPNIQNKFIENHVLKVVATDIEDLFGNPAELVQWEFFVNRSNLYWTGGDIDAVVLEGNQLIVEREIRNQSGEVTSFTIPDIPDWMDILPFQGTLDPGSVLPVKFIFPADLALGAYSQLINMKTIDGDEPIMVDLRVACPPPDWSVNVSNYSFSMNYVLQLDIEGDLSSDRLDVVGAFIGGKLRGFAQVRYERDLDAYFAFLTVYSNQATGETVDFQIWDASSCSLFANNIESFPYVADGIIGTPLVPQIIHTNNQLLRKIYIHPGWNWISFNLDFPDPSISAALSSLTNPGGATIKDQSTFSAYSVMANDWFGTLTTLGFTSLYQYNSLASDSISMIGSPVDPSFPIPLNAGWNWIGYLPQLGLPVNEALGSLTPLNGDIIKGQLSFAVYVAGAGWVGNLGFLSPPNGYLLKLTNSDLLTYPDLTGLREENGSVNKSQNPSEILTYTTVDIKSKEGLQDNHWQLDPTQYEHSMNAIAIVVKQEGENILSDDDEVGAFVGNEVRGSSKAIYFPALDAHMIFLTIFANEENEVLTFKFYDSSKDEVMDLEENTGFVSNSIIGKVDDPKLLHISMTTTVTDIIIEHNKFSIYPNPFDNYLHLSFYSEVNEDVKIVFSDVYGKEVDHRFLHVNVGKNVLKWKPNIDLNPGSYFISLKGSKVSYNRKVIYIK